MLILHILCGFGVDEVASAFVTTYTAVEKRIPRAKKVLAGSKRLFDTEAPSDFATRLPAVQRALYLLFNEGYQGAFAEFAVRAEPSAWSDSRHTRSLGPHVPQQGEIAGAPRRFREIEFSLRSGSIIVGPEAGE